MFIEYCNGGDLAEFMKLKNKKLPANIIHAIMKHVVTGLAHMSTKKIMHRDLKLRNLMLHFPNHV